MAEPFEKGYWEELYKSGWGSGAGSRGQLLAYKASFLNDLFRTNGVRSVLDFGCGDGELAYLLDAELYQGYDASPTAVSICRKKLGDRPGFHFDSRLFSEITPEAVRFQPDAVLCVDALYHVIDRADLRAAIRNLFSFGSELVVLYTIPNCDMDGERAGGIARHDTTELLEAFAGGYELVRTTEKIPDTAAVFFVYRRR